jgi:hypothetical protein
MVDVFFDKRGCEACGLSKIVVKKEPQGTVSGSPRGKVNAGNRGITNINLCQYD